MHISLINAVNLIGTLFDRITIELDVKVAFTHNIVFYLQLGLILAQLCFLTILLIDWLLATYYQKRSLRFRKVKNVVPHLLYYSVLACVLAVCVLQSYIEFYLIHVTVFILFLVYVLILVFLIAVHITHCCKRTRVTDAFRESTTGLRIGTVGVLVWIPFLVAVFTSITKHDLLIYPVLVLFLLVLCNPSRKLVYFVYLR